jgi:hypothetical protein
MSDSAVTRSVNELVNSQNAITVLITASACSWNGVAHSKVRTRRDEAWNRNFDDLVRQGLLEGGPERFTISELGAATIALIAVNDDDLFAVFWLYAHYNSEPMFPSVKEVRARYEAHSRVPPWDRLLLALERMAKAGNVDTGERKHKPFYITSPKGCVLIHHATVLGFTADNITIHRNAP